MIIEKYGICLHRITKHDIELVREWRNDIKIKKHMLYQQYITVEMQQKWFQKINTIHNWYYIIRHKEQPIGLINTKNVSLQTHASENGGFIWHDDYINGSYATSAAICLMEFNFYVLSIKHNFVRVLKDNHKAVAYNKHLGYKSHPSSDDNAFQLYVMDKKRHEETGHKIKAALKKINGDGLGKITLEESERHTSYSKLITQVYKNPLSEAKTHFTLHNKNAF